MRHRLNIDDADIAAGNLRRQLIESAPSSLATINTFKGYPSDLEFFEDLVSEPVLVLGFDISHLSRQTQFLVCATGVFGFSLLYGYLQELIAVHLCNRRLGLFQAMMQFAGYTIFAHFLNTYVYRRQQNERRRRFAQPLSPTNKGAASSDNSLSDSSGSLSDLDAPPAAPAKPIVPITLYLGLSLLRALDLGMTNLAMQYINYPAKTLMKSSRVVFTMIFGVLISRKKYCVTDYAIVVAMVAGLAIFMHADANSSAVFHGTGVIMLTVSLVCDGAISNVSETIMSNYGVGQDEVSSSDE